MGDNKTASLKLNMVLNAIRSLMGILFPLITFPYVAKTLSVEDLGQYNFSSSVVSYFSLLAALGIMTYAIREGAAVRDDKEKLKQFTSEIFTINIISMFITYVLFGVSLLTVQKFQGYIALLIVFSLQILFNTLGVEWIFGIFEDYLFVTIRSILFQIVSLILLFIFVRQEGDVLQYTCVTVIASAGSNLLNFLFAKKHVKVRLTTKPDLKKHLKPIMIIFGTAVACTIYVNSDVTILGFLCGDYNVGLYSVSTKIYTVLKTISSAALMVAIPRLSYYIGKGQIEKYKKQLREILQMLVIIMVPLVVGVIMLSEEIILLLADESYMEAKMALIILCVALPCCMLATLAGQCVLIPLKKENVIFKATLISAIVNVVLNFILIPRYQQNAASITTLIAEGTAMVIQWGYALRKTKIDSILKSCVHAIIGCIPIVILCNLFSKIESMLICLVLSISSSVIIYFGILILLRDETVLGFVSGISHKLKGK